MTNHQIASHIALLAEGVAVLMIIACGFVWCGIATGAL